MTRPVEHGEAAISRDLENCARALKRAIEDRKRPPEVRRALERHLRAAIAILANGRRDGRSSRRTHAA